MVLGNSGNAVSLTPLMLPRTEASHCVGGFRNVLGRRAHRSMISSKNCLGHIIPLEAAEAEAVADDLLCESSPPLVVSRPREWR